jgi:hypothetical protein
MTFESDDIVDSGATENTAAEVETQTEEWQPESESQEPEQQETERKEESEQEEKPKRNRAQERIQQLAREKAEMAAKLAEYEAKANQPAQVSDGPAIEDFEDYSEFKKAERKWLMDEAKREFREEMLAEKQQQTQAEKQAAFESALIEASTELPDFDTIVQTGLARDLPMPISLDELAEEFGYDAKTQTRLLYELAKDEDFHEQVSGSSKLKAARLLSEKVDSFAKTTTAPKVPNTPKPIKPTSANAPVARSPEKMSDDDWYREQTKSRKGK